jgi:hypothetical protein
VVPETEFASAAMLSDAQRVPLISMELIHSYQVPKRRDKTGSRTYCGNATSLRESAKFALKTYLYENPDFPIPPSYSPLLEAALGGESRVFSGGVVESALDPTRIRFQEPHGMGAGQGVTFGGEMRFVTDIEDSHTVSINAPFSILVTSGAEFGPAITFTLGSEMRSLSLFDYWGATGVHRVACGAVVDSMQLSINGDFHQMEFQGPAAKIIDSVSFTPGAGGLTVFPDEPVLDAVRYTPIPGHLGQVWLGGGNVHTLTEGTLRISNNVVMRNREFGSSSARLAVHGDRAVSFQFSMLQDDMEESGQLYAAARKRTPVTVMLQLGQQASQLMGVFLKSVVPQIPSYDESDSRLQFVFEDCLADGVSDDELFIAIG